MENLAFLLAAGRLVASLAAAMPQGVLDTLQVPVPTGHLDQGLVAFSFLFCTLSKGFLLPTWGLSEWIRLASPSPSACRTLPQQRGLALIRSLSDFCSPGWTSVTSVLWHLYLIPKGSVPQCKCFFLTKLLFRKLILTKHAAYCQWVWFQIAKVMIYCWKFIWPDTWTWKGWLACCTFPKKFDQTTYRIFQHDRLKTFL